MRLLIANNDLSFSDSALRALKAEGYAVDWVNGAAASFAYLKSVHYDLVILDLNLVDDSGIRLLKRMRSMSFNLPILITALSNELDDKVESFQAGADDYVVRPVTTTELFLRTQALLRRGTTLQDNVIKVGDLEINRFTRKVRRGGRRIELSAKEYSLLEYMSLNPSRVLSRSTIMERVWDQPFDVATNIVDVYMGHLRRKIDEGHAIKLIRTVRGCGYALDTEQLD